MCLLCYRNTCKEKTHRGNHEYQYFKTNNTYQGESIIYTVLWLNLTDSDDGNEEDNLVVQQTVTVQGH